MNLADYFSLIIRSNPHGLRPASTNWGASGSVSSTPNLLTSNVNGYRFVYREVDGVRVVDSTGASAGSASLTLTSNKVATAHLVLETSDSELDGIADWIEWFYLGTLGTNAQSDRDVDGWTFVLETIQGFHPRVVDHVVGGE